MINLPCDLCGESAQGMYLVEGGCIVYPELEHQFLCPQHLNQSTPLAGGVVLIWEPTSNECRAATTAGDAAAQPNEGAGSLAARAGQPDTDRVGGLAGSVARSGFCHTESI